MSNSSKRMADHLGKLQLAFIPAPDVIENHRHYTHCVPFLPGELSVERTYEAKLFENIRTGIGSEQRVAMAELLSRRQREKFLFGLRGEHFGTPPRRRSRGELAKTGGTT